MKMSSLLPKRCQQSNKGTFGTVLNVSGSLEYSGAALLSSVAALKLGAGKVILCSTDNTLSAASYYAPELVLKKRKDICFENISSIILGCGLSLDNESINIFKKTIANEIPKVIDADGLNILSSGSYVLNSNSILTPHPKEMARLMNISVDEVLKNPNTIAKECLDKYQASVVVLKMHETIVVDKDNEYINKTGNSALAKAGSGDVLAGIIGGLLAQGCTCYDASRLGVYIHGLSGEIASKEMSEYSVLASDLLNYIGYAIKEII
jgi:NAD(P)H-hydrate epimerase